MQSEILRMECISKSFAGTKVLNNVNMNVLQGEVLALVGANGAGKTSLMKILAGIYTKDSGKIYFNENMEQNIIEIKNANKYFPGVHAIKDFDIAIQEGEVHAICGENGAGKSAITKVKAEVYTLDEGKIFFQGKTVGYKKVSEAQKIGICRVPQELELINDFTMIQNIGVSNIPLNKYKLIDWNIYEGKC